MNLAVDGPDCAPLAPVQPAPVLAHFVRCSNHKAVAAIRQLDFFVFERSAHIKRRFTAKAVISLRDVTGSEFAHADDITIISDRNRDVRAPPGQKP
jgi:hypothetical protein